MTTLNDKLSAKWSEGHGGAAPVAPRAPAMGSVSVRSHLMVAEGIEVVIDPGLAGLSPEQVLELHMTEEGSVGVISC